MYLLGLSIRNILKSQVFISVSAILQGRLLRGAYKNSNCLVWNSWIDIVINLGCLFLKSLADWGNFA